MDLNEVTGVVLNRHPWELSRTKCVLAAFSKYMKKMHKDGKGKKYMNVGAGDLYFDNALLEEYPQEQVHAVDIAYRELSSEDGRIHKYHYLEEIGEETFDYAIMMDSLEYMEDDVKYVRDMTRKIRSGGYFFFTLPAFPILFSDHDIMVKNFRRYSRKSFEAVIAGVQDLDIEEAYYFYTSLFLVRFVQKFLRIPIDPKHHITAHWKYSEKGPVTSFITGCLNLDFKVNRLLSRTGLRLPGLSMLVVCRKQKHK